MNTKKNKHIKVGKTDKKTTPKGSSEKEEKKQSVPVKNEDDIIVEEEGDCIGHWADCEECHMCDLDEDCKAMTENINGE